MDLWFLAPVLEFVLVAVILALYVLGCLLALIIAGVVIGMTTAWTVAVCWGADRVVFLDFLERHCKTAWGGLRPGKSLTYDDNLCH